MVKSRNPGRAPANVPHQTLMSQTTQRIGRGMARYALITPVRDEEKYIGALMESILAQQVRPAKWTIVDDGSTDRTAGIIQASAHNAVFDEAVKLPQLEQ